LTASAGFALSWVENPEWLDFCSEYIPSAKNPSRKVLTTRILPKSLGIAQAASRKEIRPGANIATATCDGWSGQNNHHYIAFMAAVGGKVITSSSVIFHALLTSTF
jgi:hypothetical protein